MTLNHCVECATAFAPNKKSGRRQLFCSAKCRDRERNRRWVAEHGIQRSAAYYRDHPEKQEARRAKSAERTRRVGWTEQRRANSQKRRALRIGATAESIKALDIYKRDKWRCYLCGDAIDKALAHPDPMSASLDHCVPLTNGGLHVPLNLKAAHLRCNCAKGNRPVDQAAQFMMDFGRTTLIHHEVAKAEPPQVIVTCPCGTTFARGRRRRYCSRPCMVKATRIAMREKYVPKIRRHPHHRVTWGNTEGVAYSESPADRVGQSAPLPASHRVQVSEDFRDEDEGRVPRWLAEPDHRARGGGAGPAPGEPGGVYCAIMGS